MPWYRLQQTGRCLLLLQKVGMQGVEIGHIDAVQDTPLGRAPAQLVAVRAPPHPVVARCVHIHSATDQLFRLADDSILHLEFQTTQRPGDFLRFGANSLDVCQRYGKPVWTVVLYGAGIRSAPDTWQSGSHTVRVQNILVGQEDGDAVLQRLREKAARGEPFTPTDRVDLILSPLMRQSRPVQDVLRAAAPLTQRLPEGQQEPTGGALLGLA
jgi:hypothetical protein